MEKEREGMKLNRLEEEYKERRSVEAMGEKGEGRERERRMRR